MKEQKYTHPASSQQKVEREFNHCQENTNKACLFPCWDEILGNIISLSVDSFSVSKLCRIFQAESPVWPAGSRFRSAGGVKPMRDASNSLKCIQTSSGINGAVYGFSHIVIWLHIYSTKSNPNFKSSNNWGWSASAPSPPLVMFPPSFCVGLCCMCGRAFTWTLPILPPALQHALTQGLQYKNLISSSIIHQVIR